MTMNFDGREEDGRIQREKKMVISGIALDIYDLYRKG